VFIRGLVSRDEYDTSEEDREADIERVERGTLSPIMVRALAAARRLRDWWDARLAAGDIAGTPHGYRLTLDAEDALLHRLATATGVPEAGAS
jgi:hypothetical protein